MTVGAIQTATRANLEGHSVWRSEQLMAGCRRSSRQLLALKRLAALVIRWYWFVKIVGEYIVDSRLPHWLVPWKHTQAASRSTALFRIFQETLTNVARHANAHLVTISLKMEEKHVILEVYDDGIGITIEEIAGPRSIGLLGVKERALAFGGEFHIEGAPGQGTHVHVSIPV